jgi:protein phosphatase
MKLSIPELSLVLLVGASGSGKSSFGRKHFLPTEVISSDFCRGLISDDENDQAATKDAFELLDAIARKRLARGKLTVIDATSVQPESRKPLIEIALDHAFAVAIVFDLPERLCQDRNRSRADRQFGPHVMRNQSQQLRHSLQFLVQVAREGPRAEQDCGCRCVQAWVVMATLRRARRCPVCQRSELLMEPHQE